MPAAPYRRRERRYRFQNSKARILRPKEATLSLRPPLYKQYLTLIIAKIEVFPAARREKTAGIQIRRYFRKLDPKVELCTNFKKNC